MNRPREVVPCLENQDMKRAFQLVFLGLIFISPLIPAQIQEHAIGSPDDKWQKVQSGDREIYVKMNGFFYSRPQYPGYGFHTYIVTNLLENNIVGAPQSVMNDVEGNCSTRTFHVLGSLFFAGKNRSGEAMKSLPPEDVERKLVPGSPFEKAFEMLCRVATEQK